MTLAAGACLGPYEIVSLIGAGGMGEVYRATDTRLDRAVAIKILNPALAADSQFHDRFDREARAISQLTHPHICTLYDVGQHEGHAYLVLEFLEGETLAARLGRAKDRPLPLNEALSIARQVADALATAHRAGIVHRDLKPGNVMLTKSGAKLLDFGLAKPTSTQSLGASASVALSALTAAPTLTSPLTTEGSIVGTLLYMAPEVLQGGEADTRSDLFAFGVMLYEMLSGRKAFSGKTQVGVMAAILEHDPPSLSSLQPSTPRALDRLVRTCLEKDPDQRWQSARDVQRELEWIADTEASEPRTPHPEPTPSTQHPEPRTRLRPLWAAASALLAIGAAGVTWAALRWNREPPPQPVRFAIVPPPVQPLSILGFDRDIAITPDGGNIVYRVGPAGTTAGSQLAVRPLDQLDARLLPGITGVRDPFMSADGRWVGFFGGNGGDLKKVSILGGSPVTLCSYNGNPRGASWGLDDTIVFATTELATGLISVKSGGGDPKVLTKPDTASGEADHLFPFILPGGQSILFTITGSNQPAENAQVAVLDVKTGQKKILVRGGTDARYVDPSTGSGQAPSTSPGQAGYLVYAAAGTLRAVRFDLTRLEVIGDPVPVVENVRSGNDGEANLMVSQNGTLVYVPGSAQDIVARSLVWINRQGREEPIKAPPRAYRIPRLWPDGTRVALDIADQRNDIWIWDLKRETLTRLTTDPAPDMWPVWTPDNLRIVFASARNGGVPNLYWRAADGTGTDMRLTTSSNAQLPNSFSPDGNTLVLMEVMPKNGNDLNLLRFERPGTGPTGGSQNPTEPLVSSAFTENAGDVSPDGRYLAYYSNQSGPNQVYVRPFPKADSGLRQISNGGGSSRPQWSRSGRELFYLTPTSLMSVSVQTVPTFSAGTPTKVFDVSGVYAAQNTRTYDVSADGQRFPMIKLPSLTDPNSTAPPPGMVVVEHWTEELKQKLPPK